MKGIVLAGGAGSRLDPMTRIVVKQLQPVYDKPMIYYPLATLLEAGVREILLISTPDDVPRFEALLGNGHQWGVEISYAVQTSPRGIAEALIIGREFIADQSVVLILGDNIFYGNMDLESILASFERGATIFAYPVHDPTRYGIVVLDEGNEVLDLIEKPAKPASNLAVPGLYVYDGQACQFAMELVPSFRGELEITDLNLAYLRRGQLRAIQLGRGIAWLDSGTHESLLEAANFIATIERRQGFKIACLEEIAIKRGYVSISRLQAEIGRMPHSAYRTYVETVAKEHAGRP